MLEIKGLIARDDSQEKNSAPSERYCLNNGTTKRHAVRISGGVGIALASLASPVDSPTQVKADTGQTITRNGVELTLLHPAKWDQVQIDKQIGVGIMRQKGASLDLATRVAQEYIWRASPMPEYKDKFYIVDVNFTSGMPDFDCDITAFCRRWQLKNQTIEWVSATTNRIFQETIVLMESKNGAGYGSSVNEFTWTVPPLNTDAAIALPDPRFKTVIFRN